MSPVLAPGSRIGLMGGGQLGRGLWDGLPEQTAVRHYEINASGGERRFAFEPRQPSVERGTGGARHEELVPIVGDEYEVARSRAHRGITPRRLQCQCGRTCSAEGMTVPEPERERFVLAPGLLHTVGEIRVPRALQPGHLIRDRNVRAQPSAEVVARAKLRLEGGHLDRLRRLGAGCGPQQQDG